MGFGRKHIVAGLRALAMACVTVCAPVSGVQADIGDRVTTVATVAQSDERGTLTLSTNEASFTIEARRTPSEIEFFRVIDDAPDAISVQLNGSDFSPSGNLEGPFESFEEPILLSQKPLDRTSPTNLVPARTYFTGELAVVRVVDLGQNGNSDRIETVAIRVISDSGDTITLRLYEDSPNSGHFYGFVPSSSLSSAPNDRTLTAPQNTVLTATYVDAFDTTEVSTDTALVDPSGLLFDSYTGAAINGARVSIVDADTGLPANILGIDGTSTYPASVETGATVRDSSGLSYPATSGAFFFPILPPGRYQLIVDAPEGYNFPSRRSSQEIAGLPDGPFELGSDASFGIAFETTITGPLNIDVPIDPAGDLTIQKRASEIQAALGDFIGYTIALENRGTIPAPYNLQDDLPQGLRYVAGSAHQDGALISDPNISADGETLLFDGGLVLPGSTIQLTYLASVGPGTPQGEAINRAVAVNSSGAALSNRAEAAVFIQEDLLTSRLTIIGRVAEAACTPEDTWARAIEDGQGVAGVRLYMETGQYVVTDENGLYHFEGVRPGTHIVQVDEATLPDGYEPVICEENSRYAGSAFSKFVDAQGGTLWRANFYLRKIESAHSDDPASADVQTLEGTIEQAAKPLADFDWISPTLDHTPDGRSIDLAIQHPSDTPVRLELNGAPVGGLNYAGRELDASGRSAISRWTGVDIQRGRNAFIAVRLDPEGNAIDQIERDVWFIDEVDRATLVDDQSVLVADGRSKPVIAVRLEAANGQAVHEGRIIEVSIAEPYRLARAAENEFESPVDAGFSAVTGIRTGANGIAYIELEPTLESGRVRVQIPLQDGAVTDLDVWLQPEKRDWIIVGLAEAEGLISHVSGPGPIADEDITTDGRFAFFAKGVIKGDWLLTMAVDTAKRRGAQDGELFDEIDPNAYYTLYGDRTWQSNNAESRYPVYVKLEKRTFQALFGDYETGFTETQLGRYSRRLSGLKADFNGDRMSATAFAAETNQRFIKDELAADGTSGPFLLGSAPLVRSSEVITIETRNRLRPDEILSQRPLNRYIDYEIDYITGELFFRQPIAVTDETLNPNVIVVDYETSDTGSRGVTAGLRGTLDLIPERAKAGITFVHEDDGPTRESGASQLAAVDLRANLDTKTELRVEYAVSETQSDLGNTDGEAILMEATRRSDTVTVTSYFREESEGFGLGQQASNTSAIRRIGGQLSAELQVKDTANGKNRLVRSLEGQVYQETNLSQDAKRSVADIVWQQESQTLGLQAGLRAVAEDFADADVPRQSVLAIAGARHSFIDQGLTISAIVETPITTTSKNDDESTLFPGRTVFGLDKTLGNRATANVRHEVTNGANASGQNTVAGINWEPLAGTKLHAATDMLTSDSGRRIGATVGVDQVWRVDDAWTVGGGFAQRTNIDGSDDAVDVTPDAAISPLEDGVRSSLTQSEQYQSGYLGASYQVDGMAGSGRIEARDSTQGTRLVTTLGGAREITKTLSFSGAARHYWEAPTDQAKRTETDIRFGAAWRPRGEGTTLLNRLDVGHAKETDVQERTKIVNNLVLNTMVSKQTQLSVYHGVKWVETRFEGASANGTTQLLGAELRHDITKKVDLGLQSTWVSSDASGTQSWSFGPSIGISPEKNIWVSLGWNVSGFDDQDFEAAKYRNEGPYIKLRAKFDQHTAKGLLNRLGLGAD